MGVTELLKKKKKKNTFTKEETVFRLQFPKSWSCHYSFSPRRKDPERSKTLV